MPVAVLYSRALSALQAPLVTVEVHLANGLPMFNLVGLPETEVKESKDRVRAALQNAQFDFPARRITVILAPWSIRRGRCSRCARISPERKHCRGSTNRRSLRFPISIRIWPTSKASRRRDARSRLRRRDSTAC